MDYFPCVCHETLALNSNLVNLGTCGSGCNYKLYYYNPLEMHG